MNQSNEIDVSKIWDKIKNGKKFILTSVVSATLIGVIISYMLPKTYLAEAVILPLSSSSNSMGAAQSFLGGLGLATATSKAANSELLALLASRTLAEMVVEDDDLMKKLYKKSPSGPPPIEQVANLVKSAVKVADDVKRGTLRISVEQDDPQLAYEILNGYIKNLQKYVADNALTQAKYKRIYIEGQLAKNKAGFLEAGMTLNQYYNDGRISSVESNTTVNIEDYPYDSTLDTQNQEVGSWFEWEKQKVGVSTKHFQKVVPNVPHQIYLQYLTLQKENLVRINAMLAQQYELAKLEEAKNDLAYQVIDKPLLPRQRHKPHRRTIVTTFFLAALCISTIMVVVGIQGQEIKSV